MVVQHLGQFSEVGEVALEVFDQLCPVIGQLTQLAAFVASGPDALGDVLRPLGLLVGFGAVALDKAAKACGVQKRDLGCRPRCLRRRLRWRRCWWLHVWQRLHQRVHGVVDGRIERLTTN